MSVFITWLAALPALLGLAVLTWLLATARCNVGLVDVAWSLFYLLGAVVYFFASDAPRTRALLVLLLVAFWALRLSSYLAARNWNAPEDRRYRDIRARNEPGFTWKSIYLVFGLQAALAWLLSAPLAGAIAANTPLGFLDILGAFVVVFGIGFESIADAQLARFRADPANVAGVMDRGLWRYTRHPNYFGEFCVSWGLYLIALSGGAWWTAFSPLVMTVLLLRVSGVALLERDIADRRPAYGQYVARTNAFLPWRPRP